MNQTLKCVIFDMDGTLIESEKVYLSAFHDAFNKNGFHVDTDFVKIFIGMSGEEEMLEIDKITSCSEKSNKIFKEMLDDAHSKFNASNVDLKPGATQLLDYCQKQQLKIGLATSTHEKAARETLEKIGLLSYFNFFVFGDEVEIPKPHPMIYHLAIQRSGFSHENCLIVEDSLSGVTSAKKAQLTVVQICDDVAPVDLADYHVNTLSELIPIVNKLLVKKG